MARELRRDEQGAALAEFGLIAPVLMILLMGAFDMGHRLYARAILQGAVQKAARDTGLEGGSLAAQQAAIDTRVLEQVREVHNTATVTFNRRSYRNFATAAAPAETFTDSEPFDGLCNNGEPWMDINRNGSRDADIGVVGQGGAEDAVIYSVRMQYPAVTPVTGLFGLDGSVDFTARTVLRNQPFNAQGSDPPPIQRNCA